ncbi:putative Origin recognition complex subunit 2 [Seiridium unicorne]|uniref:Origin recognition complex subunit 2 n=1 Tax=Seiridium unicorne TaxID=138068 RepID=A0ABR2UNF5_9PEZI
MAGTSTKLSPRKRIRRGAESEYEDGGQPEVAEQLPIKRKRGRPSNASRLAERAAQQQKSVYDVPTDEDGETDGVAAPLGQAETPRSRRTKRATGSPGVTGADKAANDHSRTPQKRQPAGTKAVETPSQKTRTIANGETPRWRRNDRSARKKSARALIESVVGGNASDEDDDQGIAREIYESSEEDDVEDVPDDDEEIRDGEGVEDPSATPSKKARGRKKGSTTKARRKSPTPPRDLPPHELYFAQNRPGGSKTSGNSLASLQLLTHDEYFSIWNSYKDPHDDDVQFLQDLHADSFPQWAFELSQGFSICCYGYGSKRPLLHKFANYIYNTTADRIKSRIVIVNGYVRNTSIREILGTVGSAVDPAYRLPAGNPSALLDDVRSFLTSHEISITIILNSIDAMPLRKSGMQAILAQLASHPSVQLICSADTPDFSLLWDSGLRSAFDFTFHDCTTFAPFTAEMDVVDDVHELLGRKARRVGGKEGVAYVLRSLPENAKNLFRLLVTEVLVAMDDEGVTAGENPGVEYRMLYGKAVEEFICSSEIAFRTLLKEFHDHQMITSRKDVLGTELLSVPFRKEELEAILEDLMA